VKVLPIDRQDHSKDTGLPPNGGVSSDTSGGEKTLAGKAIGTAWDFVAGKPVSQEARAERAHEADQYAEIAADTFAAIPKFKSTVGGLARGVLAGRCQRNQECWRLDRRFRFQRSRRRLAQQGWQAGPL
jgi:hypothetical protein